MTDKVKRFLLKNSFLYIIALILALLFFDVEEIGPESTLIGLAGVNGGFRNICHFNETIGYSPFFYGAVKVMFFISIAVCIFWSILFVRDMIKSGRLDGVGTDKNFAATFFLYIITMIICGIFKLLPVNYSPALFEGQVKLSSSFPAFHVLWIIISMGTTAFHIWEKFLEKKRIAIALSVLLGIFAALGIILGLICGIYWFTDIVGAILFGVMLIMLYSFFFDI